MSADDGSEGGLPGRRSVAGTGLLRELTDATVLAAADVRTALTLASIVGGAPADVELAIALAVRAVRTGHVHVDLATVPTAVAPDDEEAEFDPAALDWPDPDRWLATLADNPLVATGPTGNDDRPLRLLGSQLYLDRYWRQERALAADLLARVTGAPPAVDEPTLADGLARLFPAAATSPADARQAGAAAAAVRSRFTVVAGGPGTGKTTTVARIVALLHEQTAAAGRRSPRIALAAPTGKAAARLAESVQSQAEALDTEPAVRATVAATPATTIHRLLGWLPSSRGRFRHDAANRLAHDVVIVDESSMVGLSLMARLIEAVRPDARLILVGDPHQLASVDAGAVLGDIVASSLPGTVTLQGVHRFGGAIAELATGIESADAQAVLRILRSGDPSIQWLELDVDAEPADDPALAEVRALVVEAGRKVTRAARAGDAETALHALAEVQVLCAHRRGPAGAARWRTELERVLRREISGYGGGLWYPGRPVLVTRNDPTLGVFNGDTGVVVDQGGRLRAVFGGRRDLLSVRPSRIAALDSLHAMTIHTAQGSQFGTVVVRLPQASSPILTRELLYTAVTRAQRRLIVIGTETTITAALARPVARASGLAAALSPDPVGAPEGSVVQM